MCDGKKTETDRSNDIIHFSFRGLTSKFQIYSKKINLHWKYNNITLISELQINISLFIFYYNFILHVLSYRVICLRIEKEKNRSLVYSLQMIETNRYHDYIVFNDIYSE